MTTEEMRLLFKNEILGRAAEIDPDDELDWLSLSMGFFLAKGADHEQAFELAVRERYETDEEGAR